MKLFNIGRTEQCLTTEPALFICKWFDENNYRYYRIGFVSPFKKEGMVQDFYRMDERWKTYRTGWFFEIRILSATKAQFIADEDGGYNQVKEL